MKWCEDNGIGYIFGLAGNKVLDAPAGDAADDLKVRRAEQGADKLRAFADIRYGAKSWGPRTQGHRPPRGHPAGLRCPLRRHLVAGHLPPSLRGRLLPPRPSRDLIKMHKAQLASDHTSCRSPIANQVRLVLHTAAYWLMPALRDAIPAVRRGHHALDSIH